MQVTVSFAKNMVVMDATGKTITLLDVKDVIINASTVGINNDTDTITDVVDNKELNLNEDVNKFIEICIKDSKSTYSKYIVILKEKLIRDEFERFGPIISIQGGTIVYEDHRDAQDAYEHFKELAKIQGIKKKYIKNYYSVFVNK
jgi:hypothetical protein